MGLGGRGRRGTWTDLESGFPAGPIGNPEPGVSSGTVSILAAPLPSLSSTPPATCTCASGEGGGVWKAPCALHRTGDCSSEAWGFSVGVERAPAPVHPRLSLADRGVEGMAGGQREEAEGPMAGGCGCGMTGEASFLSHS